MNNEKDEYNISFLLEDSVVDELQDNNVSLKQLLEDFEKEDVKMKEEEQEKQWPFGKEDKYINYDFLNQDDVPDKKISYFEKKYIYAGNDELYYETEYTVKELMKICNYYGISKNIKAAKCKKTDIIATIVYFENCGENMDIVEKRHKMWAYITELFGDPRMKCYLLW